MVKHNISLMCFRLFKKDKIPSVQLEENFTSITKSHGSGEIEDTVKLIIHCFTVNFLNYKVKPLSS